MPFTNKSSLTSLDSQLHLNFATSEDVSSFPKKVEKTSNAHSCNWYCIIISMHTFQIKAQGDTRIHPLLDSNYGYFVPARLGKCLSRDDCDCSAGSCTCHLIENTIGKAVHARIGPEMSFWGWEGIHHKCLRHPFKILWMVSTRFCYRQPKRDIHSVFVDSVIWRNYSDRVWMADS